MFKGTYQHTIDPKGRLIIPSKYREMLGDTFVVTKGLDGCLFVYGNEDWEAFETKLKQLPLNDKNARKFARYFLAGANDVELDKQGRILLPVNLREAAGIDKEVVLAGVGNRIEIWSKEAWENEEVGEEDMDDIEEKMSSMGLLF